MRIDNDRGDVVVAMLGDLGRDLPYSEQHYWKSFNIATKGSFSSTAIRRGFLAEWADAAALDLQFRRLYPDLNRAWKDRFGWALFLEPDVDDAHLLQQVRLLPEDRQTSFDEAVLVLAKLVVDALNEAELERLGGPGVQNEKGLQKLERFLDLTAARNRTTIAETFRNLQGIRSAGAAHWKGTRYARLRASAASSDRREWFADVLERVVRALEELKAIATAGPAVSKGAGL